MTPPTEINGTEITGATIDGQEVQEITIDGQTVFTARPETPDTQNLVLHVDASQESLNNNDTTSTITDFSGNNNDFSGDAVTFKTNAINGLPAFQFNDNILTNNQTLSDPFVLAVVFESTANGTEARYFGDDSTEMILFYDTGEFNTGIELRFDANDSNRIKQSLSVPTNVFQTFVHSVDGSSSIRRDGSQVASGFIGSNTVTGLNIGAVGGRRERGLKGNISELLLYDTITNISDLENYLSERYGTF